MDKAALRQQFKESRNNAPYKQLKLNDIQQLIEKSNHIAAYLPINNEIDTVSFIKWTLSNTPKKSIYLPRPTPNSYELAKIINLDTDIIKGPYDTQIPHPRLSQFNPKKIELWIIPGLAFTASGIRLGYGKGIYDQLLANTSGYKLGVAHYCQKTTQLPQDPWDINMNSVLFY